MGEATAGNYIRRISKIVDWLITDANIADYNPYKPHIHRFDQVYKDTEKLDVDLSDLRQAVQDTRKSKIVLFVYLMLILKTGARRGETINLDHRDIHLDHPIAETMPEPRREVYNYPDTIYIDSSKSEGEVHNGEKRQCGNKKLSSRKIPFDKELKNTLVWWIPLSPPSTSPAKPLLRKVNDPEARRPADSTIGGWVTAWARDHGFNDKEKKHFGVDSHWCRHWFTTMLRARIDNNEVIIGSAKEYVEGLRGDTTSGVIGTYTQEWEETRASGDKTYREVYEENIPQLLVNEE